MNDNERAEWIIATLAARDFDVPEFHAMQTEIAAKWKSDRAELADAKDILCEARDKLFYVASGLDDLSHEDWCAARELAGRIDAFVAGSNK